MKEYEITLTHRFLIKTDDIRQVQEDYEFPDLHTPNVEWVEFLDGTFTSEEQ
jgi:hypothetical protein